MHAWARISCVWLLPGGSGPHVIAPLDQHSNDLLRARPLLHDLPVAQSYDDVTESVELEIAPPVFLERVVVVVEAASVQLQDQALADEHIDTANAADLHLGSHSHSPPLQAVAGERLEPRLARGIAKDEKVT